MELFILFSYFEIHDKKIIPLFNPLQERLIVDRIKKN